VHDGHAAAPNLAAKAIPSTKHFGQRERLIGENSRKAICRYTLERRIGLLAIGHEALDLRLTSRIAFAQLAQ
jgi:hypothetical protein